MKYKELISKINCDITNDNDLIYHIDAIEKYLYRDDSKILKILLLNEFNIIFNYVTRNVKISEVINPNWIANNKKNINNKIINIYYKEVLIQKSVMF